MEQLVALIGFSFVSSVTPGPNNMLLWASGATFGFRRTVPHVLGTALGIGAMAMAVVVGLGALLGRSCRARRRDEGRRLGLPALSRVAGRRRGRAPAEGRCARPLGLLQAAAFQVVNPKAWIFAIGAVTTFRPAELSSFAGGALVAVVMMIVVALVVGGGDRRR